MSSRIREAPIRKPVLPSGHPIAEVFDMKTKLAAVALVLAFVPGLAAAQCFGEHEQVTMSCPEGQIFDTEAQSCITPTG